MNEDFEDLLKLFDYALSSDNPAVKKALKNLLLVVSIVEPQEEKPNRGPLHDLKREIQDLKMQLAVMRSELATLRQSPNTAYPSTYPTYPSTHPPYVPWVYTGSVTTSTSTTTSSSSEIDKELKKLLELKVQTWNLKESIENDDK